MNFLLRFKDIKPLATLLGWLFITPIAGKQEEANKKEQWAEGWHSYKWQYQGRQLSVVCQGKNFKKNKQQMETEIDKELAAEEGAADGSLDKGALKS